MRRAARAGAAGLIGIWLTAIAAHAFPPTGRRVSLGFGGGASVGNDGAAQEGTPVPMEIELLLRYEHPFGDRFALAATGSAFVWTEGGAALDAGYESARLDLGIAPLWRLLRRPLGEFFWIELYLALPVGVSMPFVRPPPRRAFSEHIEDRTGWFVGATLGGDLFISRRWGGFLECGYQRSATGIRSVITPHDGSPAIRQQIDYVDHQVICSYGALFAF